MSFLPDATLVDQNFALVVDALFGFGFRPPVRPEFVEVLQKLCKFKVCLSAEFFPIEPESEHCLESRLVNRK